MISRVDLAGIYGKDARVVLVGTYRRGHNLWSS